MSESIEPNTEPVPAAPVSNTPETTVVETPRSNRVVQAASWVGIVAGTVFVVAVIFFSGFILGKQSGDGGHGGGPRAQHEMMFRDGPPGPPMSRPGQGPEAGGPGSFGPSPGPPERP